MRAREFIQESSGDIIEDEADVRGDDILASVLMDLRHEAHHKHDVPMIRVDSLINLVRGQPGGEMFSVENLLDAYKSNETIKNLIKDIKDNKDGIKYAYLTTFADEPESGELDQAAGSMTNPEKTIDSMAKRALSKRS